jgi:hypothetical protein
LNAEQATQVNAGLQILTSDGNLVWGFNAKNSRSLVFQTNQTERMRIDSSGNVGIGTSSPSRLLEIADSTQATGAVLRLSNTASGSTWTTGDTIGTLEFYSSDASAAGNKALIEAVQLTGSSNLTYPSLVGLDFYASSLNNTDLAVRISPSTLRIHSAEDKSWSVGDKVASLEFFSADNSGNSANSVRASIDCVAQSTFGSSHGLSFTTKGDSAGDPVERVRATLELEGRQMLNYQFLVMVILVVFCLIMVVVIMILCDFIMPQIAQTLIFSLPTTEQEGQKLRLKAMAQLN